MSFELVSYEESCVLFVISILLHMERDHKKYEFIKVQMVLKLQADSHYGEVWGF